jgi:hypothetical protein
MTLKALTASPALVMMAALVLPISASQATMITYTANLSGPAESPPNMSPGTGFATVTTDDVAHTLFVDVTFSGLTSGTTASHIHTPTPAPGTGTAGVATTTPTFAGFPLGVRSDNTSVLLYSILLISLLAARTLSSPLPPSPPAEEGTARRDQTWEACTGDGTGNGARRLGDEVELARAEANQ